MVSEPIIYASVGVGLGVFLSVIGASIGISISAPAIAGAGTERPEIVSKSLIATILAEAIAIYGLVVGLLSIFRLASLTPADTDIAFRIFSGGLIMGIAAVAAGIGIGTSGSALGFAAAGKTELFFKGGVSLVLPEGLTILPLLAGPVLLIYNQPIQTNR